MATNYPFNLDSNRTLPNIYDVITLATLTSMLGVTDTVINVTNTSAYPAQNGLIVIDNEQILYTGVTSTSFTGCTRGMFGTVNTSHNSGTQVQSKVTASAYTNLRDAILQIEALLGASGNNIALLETNSSFTSQQSSTGWSFTLSTPAGVDEWQIVPTNADGIATLNILYTGPSATSTVNIDNMSIPYTNLYTDQYASNLVLNYSLGNGHEVLITGDVASCEVQNITKGQTFILQIEQDNVGGHTFNFSSQFSGVTPQMVDSDANSVTTLVFFYDGTNLRLLNVSG